MTFLKRDDLWERKKLYRLRYTPVDNLPRTNFLLSQAAVGIHDMRPHLDKLCIDTNGFNVAPLRSTLPYEDSFNYKKVSTHYKTEVESLVRGICNAKHAHALDYELRRRHVTFPVATGQKYAYGQPNLIANIDVTVDSLEQIIRDLHGELAPEILKSRVQCFTVWKPLRGVVEDWPLALCDSRSLDGSDIVKSDAVYERVVAENCMIHYHPDHKWYYLSHQDHTEALVFKATDSDKKTFASCAHGSFHLPGQNNPSPRESIDMRVLVMHADVNYPEDVEWHT